MGSLAGDDAVARVPKSSSTRSEVNKSLGVEGKPPRPVTVNLLSLSPLAAQLESICRVGSTN
jgi:hypothetical protein